MFRDPTSRKKNDIKTPEGKKNGEGIGGAGGTIREKKKNVVWKKQGPGGLIRGLDIGAPVMRQRKTRSSELRLPS